MFDIVNYTEAASLQDAIALSTQDKNVQLIAGGTDVLIKTRERKEGYVGRHLVGIARVPELQGVRLEPNGDIFIGAANTFTQVERNPIVRDHLLSLAVAVGTVGGPQVRNMGTIGGNVCNGATSADSASTLFAYQAVLVIANENGWREVPIDEFYLGPGRVALQSGDVLVAIKITPENYRGFTGQYIKFAQRNAMDIATLGCSVWLKMKGECVEDLRIAYGVAGPVPLRAKQAEAFAKGKKLDEEIMRQIAEQCLEDTKARDSWRASKAFREQLIKELPIRAMRDARNQI